MAARIVRRGGCPAYNRARMEPCGGAALVGEVGAIRVLCGQGAYVKDTGSHTRGLPLSCLHACAAPNEHACSAPHESPCCSPFGKGGQGGFAFNRDVKRCRGKKQIPRAIEYAETSYPRRRGPLFQRGRCCFEGGDGWDNVDAFGGHAPPIRSDMATPCATNNQPSTLIASPAHQSRSPRSTSTRPPATTRRASRPPSQ